MSKAKKKSSSTGTIALNKRAKYDYFVDQKFEAGLVLSGWEVKSLRMGKVQIKVQGSLRELEAITDNEEELKTGTMVKVTKIVSAELLLVETLSK